MTNAQKPNKHRRNKSCKKSTTAGSRAHYKKPKHGKGKGKIQAEKKKRR